MGKLAKGIGGFFQTIGKIFGLEMEAKVDTGPYNKDLLTNETAPTSYIGVVYGYRRKAGVRIATFVRGDSNQYLYAVYALSHGPVSGVFNPRMNDVAFSHPHSEPYVEWSYMDGSDTQDATTDPLIVEIGAEWDTVNGKLKGVAFAVIKLTINKEYMSEFGNVTFDVAGRLVYDPRTTLTVWSDNPALCVLDYLTNPIYGKGMTYPQDFDVNSYIDAANYFDETTGGVIADVVGSCTYTLNARKDGYLSVPVSTFNTLVAGDIYEVTGFVDPAENFTAAIISKSYDTVLSFTTAVEPVPVYTDIYQVFMEPLGNLSRALITSPLSLTFSKKPKRYTCNGNVDTSQTLYDNLIALSTSFNGYVTFFNGLSTIIPDRPEPVAASFNESNITGDITVQLPDKTSQLNEVTGTWFDPEFGYEQSTDTVKSSVFLARDKGRKQPKEINLPFCNSPELLERILTIELNKSRHNGPIQLTTFWDALEVLSGEVIEISDDELGWVDRTFRIVRIGIPDVYNDVALTCIPYDADDYIDGTINPRRMNEYVDYTVAGKMALPTDVTVSRIYDIDNLLVRVAWTPAAGIPYDHFDLEVYEITRDGGGVIDSATLTFSYINIYTTSFSIPDTLVDGTEYQFRVYVWSPSKQRSSIFASADYTHGQLQPPTGITVSVDGPWSVSAVPTYPVERAGQVKLTHKWYIAESVAQAEPPFAEGDLVYSGPELIWAGLKPNKDYRIWCRAVTDYDVSAEFPAGNGQSFSTPDTVEGDLGSASGKYLDYRFKRSASAPATPTGDEPVGWFDAPTTGTNTLYVTTAYKNFDGTLVVGEVWSTPSVLSGSGIMVEWSIDGATLWHSTYAEGDLYMRQSFDGGTTWSSAILVVGEASEKFSWVVYSDSMTTGLISTTDYSLTYTGVLHNQVEEAPDTADHGLYQWYLTLDVIDLSDSTILVNTLNAQHIDVDSVAAREIVVTGSVTAGDEVAGNFSRMGGADLISAYSQGLPVFLISATGGLIYGQHLTDASVEEAALAQSTKDYIQSIAGTMAGTDPTPASGGLVSLNKTLINQTITLGSLTHKSGNPVGLKLTTSGSGRYTVSTSAPSYYVQFYRGATPIGLNTLVTGTVDSHIEDTVPPTTVYDTVISGVTTLSDDPADGAYVYKAVITSLANVKNGAATFLADETVVGAATTEILNLVDVAGGVQVTDNLTANGWIYATGGITGRSDIRVKRNIKTLPNALSKLKKIRGVSYDRTDLDDSDRHIGVIAQEVEKVLPEAIKEQDGFKNVNYNALVGLLIEAVKEQQIAIDNLKRRLKKCQ